MYIYICVYIYIYSSLFVELVMHYIFFLAKLLLGYENKQWFYQIYFYEEIWLQIPPNCCYNSLRNNIFILFTNNIVNINFRLKVEWNEMIHSAFNNRTFSFDLKLFLFFTNWMNLGKGLLPPVISFYTMARCLFIFLNIVDINAIGSFFKSEFNNFC